MVKYEYVTKSFFHEATDNVQRIKSISQHYSTIVEVIQGTDPTVK